MNERNACSQERDKRRVDVARQRQQALFEERAHCRPQNGEAQPSSSGSSGSICIRIAWPCVVSNRCSCCNLLMLLLHGVGPVIMLHHRGLTVALAAAAQRRTGLCMNVRNLASVTRRCGAL